MRRTSTAADRFRGQPRESHIKVMTRNRSPFLRRLALIPMLICLFTACFVACVSSAAQTEELPAEFPPPTVTAYFSHSKLAQGDTGTLLLEIAVEPNFHIQINEFLELIAPEGSPVTSGHWVATRYAKWHAERVFAGETVLKFPVTIKNDAPLGTAEIPLTFAYQGCVEQPTYACYPPGEVPVKINVEILPARTAGERANEQIFAANGGAIGDVPPAVAGQQSPAQSEAGQGAPSEVSQPGEAATSQASPDLASRIEGTLKRGSLWAVLLVFLGGILSSFTPCVYPMIPITISFVGGCARNRAHGFFLSLFFVLGIAIMYSGLGIIAASTSFIFGAVMQSAAVMVIVAIIFLAMGASMLGAFDITLPSSWQGKMSAGAQRGGFIGAILMGMVTGLVASPCIGPVLIVLLTFAAKSGNLFVGFWLLFTYAIGLGVLFLVLGTFAGALSALPGAGSWMDTVKHIFGVVLLGMAIFFLRTVVGPQWTRFLLGIFLAFAGLFMGALTPLREGASAMKLLGKAAAILAFLSGIVVFLLWLLVVTGAPKLLFAGQPVGMLAGNQTSAVAGTAQPGATVVKHAGPDWRINDLAALDSAGASGVPAMQDFYADWCGACVELDEKTWSDPAIIAESKRFVSVKMDFTKRGEFQKTATARFALKGMPTVIFYDGQGNEVTRFVGFKPAQEVLAIMKGIGQSASGLAS